MATAAMPSAQPDFVSGKHCPPARGLRMELPRRIASLSFKRAPFPEGTIRPYDQRLNLKFHDNANIIIKIDTSEADVVWRFVFLLFGIDGILKRLRR
jgi:hypothetical protein